MHSPTFACPKVFLFTFILTSGVCNLNAEFAQKTPKILTEIEKIMGKKIETAQEMPKLDFNGCLNTVRDAVKKIELSGFKVESEEMNFEKNYQIVIKIAKKEE